MNENNQEPRINPVFVKYDAMSAVDLIKSMAEVKARKEAAEETAKEIGKEYDFLRMIKIPAKFDEEDINLLKVEGVGRCNLTGDLQAAIPADKKEQAYDWLRDNGREDIIQETVNSSTLKAMIKGMMQKGEDIPDCFRVHVFSRASITKA